MKLWPDVPVITLPSGRQFQCSKHGSVLCVSDLAPDPQFPEMLDLTACICSPTIAEQNEVLSIYRGHEEVLMEARFSG